MKYIRTKDGIFEPIQGRETNVAICCLKHGYIFKKDVIKQADTIEELIQDGDLCHLAECKMCRDRISDVKVFPREDYIGISVPGIEYSEEDVLELWIKDTKGNYIKVAQKETKEGELELL